jgi:hypothetical protein
MRRSAGGPRRGFSDRAPKTPLGWLASAGRLGYGRRAGCGGPRAVLRPWPVLARSGAAPGGPSRLTPQARDGWQRRGSDRRAPALARWWPQGPGRSLPSEIDSRSRWRLASGCLSPRAVPLAERAPRWFSGRHPRRARNQAPASSGQPVFAARATVPACFRVEGWPVPTLGPLVRCIPMAFSVPFLAVREVRERSGSHHKAAPPKRKSEWGEPPICPTDGALADRSSAGHRGGAEMAV